MDRRTEARTARWWRGGVVNGVRREALTDRCEGMGEVTGYEVDWGRGEGQIDTVGL